MNVLETDRILLRRLVEEDLQALYALYANPEMRQYYPEGVLTLEDTKKELEWFLAGHPENADLGLWAMIEKSSGRFIGRSGLLPWTINGQREIEIAYMVAKSHWRQGLGQEVAKALVGHAFDKLQIDRVIALIDPEHTASIKTAEAAGLTFESYTTMHGLPTSIYSSART